MAASLRGRHHRQPFEQLLDEQQRQTLIDAIEALPEREKLLMALYYQEEMNLKEVGAVLGVTESLFYSFTARR